MNIQILNRIITVTITAIIIFGTVAYFLASGKAQPDSISPLLYYIQMFLTLATIAVIPLSLKYVNRKRFKEERQYLIMCLARLCAINSLAIVSIMLYMTFNVASFFYLAAIQLLSLFFCYPQKAEH